MMIHKDVPIGTRKRFNMPAAPRLKTKATKIAFKILGVPPNMKSKPDKSKKKINQRLLFLETARVR